MKNSYIQFSNNYQGKQVDRIWINFSILITLWSIFFSKVIKNWGAQNNNTTFFIDSLVLPNSKPAQLSDGIWGGGEKNKPVFAFKTCESKILMIAQFFFLVIYVQI